MGSGEGGGGTGGSGSGESGTGGSGGGDIGDLIAYEAYQNSLKSGKDGDFTGNGGYGGDNTGPVGSKEPEKNEDGAVALLDAITAVPDQTFGPPSRRAGAGDLWREIEPYTGAQAPVGSLFAFVGQDVDPYSGLALGSEGLDPFTGTRVMDPFTASGPPARAGRAGSFTALRRHNLLSSPNLLASNGPLACDSSLAECPPKMVSDFNQSNLTNTIQAEMDVINVANLWAREKAQIADSTRLDVHEAISATARVTQSSEYQLAFQVNQLRNHSLEVQQSGVWVGVGQMFWGGVLLTGSGLAIYGSGGMATPLLSTMGLATGIATVSSGAVLAFSGASYTEAVRMGDQLDQAFALTSSPIRLLFGTTGLVLSGGSADVAHGYANLGGLGEDLITMRFDPSKLYAGVLPKMATKAEKGAAILLVKDVAAVGHTAQAESIQTVAKKLTGQSGLLNPRAGEELFVGDWLNNNLQVKLDNTVKSFVADPRTMAALVPPNIPYRAIPQYGGYVVEYGLKASIEREWILDTIIRGVPQSSQMVRGGAADLVLRPPFAGWNLKGWDITTARSAAAKAERGVDYTFVTYTVDWKALGL